MFSKITSNERRNQLLENKGVTPPYFFNNVVTQDNETQVYNLFNNLYNAFLVQRSLPIEKVLEYIDIKTLNDLLIIDSQQQVPWLVSSVSTNYATLSISKYAVMQYIDPEELGYLFTDYLKSRYSVRVAYDNHSDIVKVNGDPKTSGLVREGFVKASHHVFTYDKTFIDKYFDKISAELLKNLPEVETKDIPYSQVVSFIVDELRNIGNLNLEGSRIDSRGRSIYLGLRRLLNPIQNKVLRALIKINDKPLNDKSIKDVYRFICELNHNKGIGLNLEEKSNLGKSYYECRYFADNLDLHETIWLDRIYNALPNAYETWDIPIELDATASALQFYGILLNDKYYLKHTNVIGDTYQDIWSIDGLSREQVKKVVTPIIYGSTAKPNKLLDSHDIPYTQEQITKLENLIETGIFANANNFKDSIINAVNPEATMNMKIFDDSFTVYCNRYTEVGTSKVLSIFDTKSGKLKDLVIKEYEANLSAFKRYFPTLLVHNLDSQVANYVANNLKGFIITNHDAFIVHPHNARYVKELYTNKLYEIYINRELILEQFFRHSRVINPHVKVGVDKVELAYEDFNIDLILK